MKTRWMFLVLLPVFAIPASAITRVWTNSSVNPLWSTAANWSNGIPTDGDSVLLLRHPLGQSVAAINDLTNLTLQSIHCEASSYNLNGGTLRLSGNITVGGPVIGALLNITLPLEILGPSSLFLSTNSGTLTLGGVVNAPVGSVVTIEGGISFRILPASDYRAETRLQSGFMPLLSTRLRGPLVIGGTSNFATVALQTGNLFGDFPPLTILTNGAVINVSTLNSVGAFILNGGAMRLGNRSPNGDLLANGNALLTGGATLFVSSINDFGPAELNVSGSVTIAGCSLAFQPGASSITRTSVIVRNDGADPVNGIFTGLPQGGELTNNGVRYVVSYIGGDGNDITLTPIIEPARFIGIERTDGAPLFIVQGQPGFLYVIEATTNLLSPPALIPWMPIRTNGTLGNGQFTFTDSDIANAAARFYRVRSQ